MFERMDSIMETRVCSGKYGCGLEKLLTEEYFYFHKKTDNFDTTCKSCRNKQCKIRNDNHKKEIKEYNKKYKNSDIGKNFYYKINGYKLHGQSFTIEDYNKLFLKQKGKCAICEEILVKEKRGIHVDHDHETGEVRGLLCNNCNQGLGKFQESIEILKKAIIYKRKYLKYIK